MAGESLTYVVKDFIYKSTLWDLWDILKKGVINPQGNRESPLMESIMSDYPVVQPDKWVYYKTCLGSTCQRVIPQIKCYESYEWGHIKNRRIRRLRLRDGLNTPTLDNIIYVHIKDIIIQCNNLDNN